MQSGGSNFNNAREENFQSQQGAYDLLIHEGLINLLSRREVLLPRSFLRLFAIVIAGGGRTPADDSLLSRCGFCWTKNQRY
jgi:hypothetical protein